MVPAVLVPIDQRFAQLIQQFGLTKNSFAISLGKTASVVQHLIDGRNKPGFDLLCKVFEIYPNVSRDWLLLGRGPMLVSGEPAPKAVAPAASAPAVSGASAIPPLEPIDLSNVALAPPRRANGAVGAARLQPTEIAATLALAAAADLARSSAPVPANPPAPAPALAVEIPPAAPAAPTPTVAAEVPVPPLPAPPIAGPTVAGLAAPLAEVPSTPAQLTAPAPASGFSPEAYVAGALHAQHLQHQLALAEMRNQHLLEQQQMLREMLGMARQSMV